MEDLSYYTAGRRYRFKGQYISVPHIHELFQREYRCQPNKKILIPVMLLMAQEIHGMLPCFAECIYYPLPHLQKWVDTFRQGLPFVTIPDEGVLLDKLNELCIRVETRCQEMTMNHVSKYWVLIELQNDIKEWVHWCILVNQHLRLQRKKKGHVLSCQLHTQLQRLALALIPYC